MNAEGLDSMFRRATQILVNNKTRQQYPRGGRDVIDADPITPEIPTTRDDATPHVLLVGPFADDPEAHALALWGGVGFIEIRNVPDSIHATYLFCPIGGSGSDVRLDYLQAAFRLYFDDVRTIAAGKA